MEKKCKKTGETISYYLQMLGASIVHPDFKEVIPLCPEMIKKKDGDNKNDCERNAAKRYLDKLKQDFPNLKFIINEDGLSPNAPHIREIEKHKYHYILVVKPGDHKFLFDFVEEAAKKGQVEEFSFKDETNHGITHYFRILNNVPLNKSNQDIKVNFFEYWEYSEKKSEVTYHCSWITDFVVKKNNCHTLMRGGRARSKVENETFNTLKNQGYQLEHNFGLGEKYLAESFIVTMVLAFLVDQIQQLCCQLFRATWEKVGSKKALWEKVRSLFFSYKMDSMEMIYKAILYGFERGYPKIKCDTS
ncbi:MAG: transposase [Desulfobacterales bacterium]|nr:transposase [Desulfobacterales bacterium]